MAQRHFITKNGGILKSVDTDKRTVCGYFASFNTLDSDGDVFVPGAFAKSLTENKDRILHLLQHDTNLPICRPTVLKEDNIGLYFESEFPEPGQDVPDYIEDTLGFYKAGVYREHSVGFEMLQNKPDNEGKYPAWAPPWDPNNKRAANLITEAKLWEGSTVTWGANQNTPFIGLKSESMSDVIKHLQSKALILKSQKRDSSQYTILLKELEELNQLTAANPPKGSSPAMNKFLESLNQIVKTLK